MTTTGTPSSRPQTRRPRWLVAVETGKLGMVRVERGRDVDLLDESAEAGAEDDAGVRRFLEFGLNGGGGGFDLVVEVEHANNLPFGVGCVESANKLDADHTGWPGHFSASRASIPRIVNRKVSGPRSGK